MFRVLATLDPGVFERLADVTLEVPLATRVAASYHPPPGMRTSTSTPDYDLDTVFGMGCQLVPPAL